MALKCFVTKVEIYDTEIDTHIASVESFDEICCTIDFKSVIGRTDFAQVTAAVKEAVWMVTEPLEQ